MPETAWGITDLKKTLLLNWATQRQQARHYYWLKLLPFRFYYFLHLKRDNETRDDVDTVINGFKL